MPVNAHEIYEYHTIEEDHQYPEDLISEDTIREDLNLSAINDDSDGYSDDDYDEDDISDTDQDEDEEEDEEVTKYVDTVISAWDAYNRSHASHQQYRPLQTGHCRRARKKNNGYHMT